MIEEVEIIICMHAHRDDNHRDSRLSHESIHKTRYCSAFSLLRQRAPASLVIEALFTSFARPGCTKENETGVQSEADNAHVRGINNMKNISNDIDVQAAQQALLSFICNDESIAIAPYNKRYIQRVLQQLVKDIESRKFEVAGVRQSMCSSEDEDETWFVHDQVALTLIELLNSRLKSDNHIYETTNIPQGWSFKTFSYQTRIIYTDSCRPTECENNDKYISLLLSDNLFEGSTGCHEWDASFYLCEWLMTNANDLVETSQFQESTIGNNHDKILVDIGCGCGILSIFLAKELAEIMNIKKIILTDGDKDAIDNAIGNVRRNGFQNEDDTHTSHVTSTGRKHEIMGREKCQFEFFVHKWEDSLPKQRCNIADYVVAADVIYAPEAIEPLIKTIRDLLRIPSGRDPIKSSIHGSQPACFICNALRTQSSLDLLELVAREYDFTVTPPIEIPRANVFYTDHRTLDRSTMRMHILKPKIF